MNPLWSLFGAFIISYFVSRGLFRLIPPNGNPLARLALVHLVCLLGLAVIIGFVKAYYQVFAWRDALILIPAQLAWLAVDFGSGKADRSRA